MFNLFKVFNHAEFSFEKKLQLFDSLVGSIFNFGSQVWGYRYAPDIENIHTRFLRRLLNVNKSTNLSALYGEVGRWPLNVTRQILTIKY